MLSIVTSLQLVGFPHSEISGSQVVCTYPTLIAAYHVLHRLPEPRHPPFALSFFFFDVKLLSTINGRSQNLYIVNLIVFARLIRNTIKVSLLVLLLHSSIRQRSFSSDKGTKYQVQSVCPRTVENNGFEPLTPCLQSRCSSQLS